MKEHIRNVVLVHGAFADGSGWKAVANILKSDGYKVSVAQPPETSYADDQKYTKAAIDAMGGPVVLVGHSYGGSIITEAGNHPNVAALVYIAAFACIDIGLVGQQQFRHVLVAGKRCHMQRRQAKAVFGENQIRIAFEQRLDLSQVAISRGVMNLAADRGIAPSERYQHNDNGGAAQSRGMAESTKEGVDTHGCAPKFPCTVYLNLAGAALTTEMRSMGITG
jgi:pimeloyl-ACP methyl ester carboxylesterase